MNLHAIFELHTSVDPDEDRDQMRRALDRAGLTYPKADVSLVHNRTILRVGVPMPHCVEGAKVVREWLPE